MGLRTPPACCSLREDAGSLRTEDGPPGECLPAMLIDTFAPNPDAVETHSIVINASCEIVYQALWTTDLGGSALVKGLLALRSLPQFIASGFRSMPRHRKVTLQTIMNSGFGMLAEIPNQEIVLGVTGRFWRPTGNLSPFNRSDFDRPVSAGGGARGGGGFLCVGEESTKTK